MQEKTLIPPWCISARIDAHLIVYILGSGAYKVFHPLLFQKAVDILQCWPTKG